jgi:hypothetical protein
LRKINGTMIGSHFGHNGKNGRADIRKTGF